MSKKNIFLLFIFVVISSFSLTDNQAYIWTKQTHIKEAINFENSISDDIELLNQNVTLSKSIFPLVENYEMANPIIVKRNVSGDLPVYAEYFYSIPDSTIRYVSYDWEIEKYGNYFKKREIWKEESTQLEKYNSKYEKIKSELISKLGKPIVEDSEPKITQSKYGKDDYLSRNAVWETKEVYSSLNLIFASNTYRIRWYYYWKN
tara:strand:+ start:59 stop:670 length:612 start_codon:yes stop_codon:yes gene_type:complete